MCVIWGFSGTQRRCSLWSDLGKKSWLLLRWWSARSRLLFQSKASKIYKLKYPSAGRRAQEARRRPVRSSPSPACNQERERVNANMARASTPSPDDPAPPESKLQWSRWFFCRARTTTRRQHPDRRSILSLSREWCQKRIKRWKGSTWRVRSQRRDARWHKSAFCSQTLLLQHNVFPGNDSRCNCVQDDPISPAKFVLCINLHIFLHQNSKLDIVVLSPPRPPTTVPEWNEHLGVPAVLLVASPSLIFLWCEMLKEWQRRKYERSRLIKRELALVTHFKVRVWGAGSDAFIRLSAAPNRATGDTKNTPAAGLVKDRSVFTSVYQWLP